jgi:hypothetical protein
MTTFYLATFVIGVLALVGTLVFGELGDTGSGGDGLPFLSLTTLAIALFGVGAGGLVGQLTSGSAPVSVLLALGGGLGAVFLTRGLLLPYILRQQSNSHTGRASFVGQIGTVTITIPAGQWGEVEFTAPDGGRTRMRAVSDEEGTISKGARVYISDADKRNVHVVAIPQTD